MKVKLDLKTAQKKSNHQRQLIHYYNSVKTKQTSFPQYKASTGHGELVSGIAKHVF